MFGFFLQDTDSFAKKSKSALKTIRMYERQAGMSKNQGKLLIKAVLNKDLSSGDRFRSSFRGCVEN